MDLYPKAKSVAEILNDLMIRVQQLESLIGKKK